jgi:hypothetical protein
MSDGGGTFSEVWLRERRRGGSSSSAKGLNLHTGDGVQRESESVSRGLLPMGSGFHDPVEIGDHVEEEASTRQAAMGSVWWSCKEKIKG